MKESIAEQIRESAALDQHEIVEFTRDMVSIATENPPGKFYKPCIELIKNKLSGIGLQSEIIEVPADTATSGSDKYPRYCLLSYCGEGDKVLYFHGHYDVVSAQSREQFQPYEKGGNIYGRGTSDMKGGIAAMVYAVKAILTAKIKLNGKIGLVFVPDEETGGALGAQYLSDNNLLGRDGIGMLLPEPTSGVIWNAHRGALTMRITITGRPVHVGLQYRGVNAFENMAPVVTELLEVKEEVEKRMTGYTIHPAAARNSIMMIGGECTGGSNYNLVPGQCSFSIDRRINPEEDLQTEKQKIVSILEKFRKDGIDIEFEMIQEEKSSGISEDSPFAQTLVKNIARVTGRPAKFEMCPGLLETRFYTEKGMPAFAYGPGLLSVSHGPDEFIKVKDIVNCAVIYALTALDVLTD
ncbi:M20 family metallopeptidase [candidate division KSB1 bacterium]